MGRGMAERWAAMSEEEKKAAIEHRKQKAKENKENGIVKKLTLGRAVKMKCADCYCGNKAEVRRCNSGPDSKFPCPLWMWRCRNPHNTQALSAEEEDVLDDDDQEEENEDSLPEVNLDKEIQPIPE